MKLIQIIAFLITVATADAGWFSDKEQQQKIQQYEEALQCERIATGVWQLIAGTFALGAVVLFTVGTALGSTTRRHEKKR